MIDIRTTEEGRAHLVMELRALDCWQEDKFVKRVPRKEKEAVFGTIENYKRLVESGTIRQFILNNSHFIPESDAWATMWHTNKKPKKQAPNVELTGAAPQAERPC